MKPFKTLEDAWVRPIAEFADKASSDLAGGFVGPMMLAMLSVYIVFMGFQILRGQSEEPIMDIGVRLLKLAIIAAFVTNIDVYKRFVVEAAVAIPEGVQNALLGAAGAQKSTASSFDALIETMGQVLNTLWKGTGITAPAKSFQAAVGTAFVVLGFGFALVSMFFVTLYAKAGMYFVLAIGPVFIATAMFKVSERFFNNFVDQLVTFATMQALAAAVVALALKVMTDMAKPMAGVDDILMMTLSVVCICTFITALTSLLPGLANKLGGHGAGFAQVAPGRWNALKGAGNLALASSAAANGAFGATTSAGASESFARSGDRLSRGIAQLRSVGRDMAGASPSAIRPPELGREPVFARAGSAAADGPIRSSRGSAGGGSVGAGGGLAAARTVAGTGAAAGVMMGGAAAADAAVQMGRTTASAPTGSFTQTSDASPSGSLERVQSFEFGDRGGSRDLGMTVASPAVDGSAAAPSVGGGYPVADRSVARSETVANAPASVTVSEAPSVTRPEVSATADAAPSASQTIAPSASPASAGEGSGRSETVQPRGRLEP